MRRVSICMLVLLGACASSEPEWTAEQQAEMEKRNAALLDQHNQIWDLMSLSTSAKDELNAIVLAVSSQIMKNKAHRPEMMKETAEPKRTEKPTHDQYVAKHKERFDKLNISEPTQKELLASAEFVWKALHDKEGKFTDEEKKVAQTIQKMMMALKGPPPCCDDNIFKRASKQ